MPTTTVSASTVVQPCCIGEYVCPAGRLCQLVDSASGIHPRYARHYIRRVRGNNHDPITKFLVRCGVPHEPCVLNPAKTTVFSFPMTSPASAVVRDRLTALEHLDVCKTYQKHWCEMKASVTVSIREHEWGDVRDYVLRNFEQLAGVSFLPFDCGTYAQTPYEAIDEAAYKKLSQAMPTAVPWAELASLYNEGPKGCVLACTAGGGGGCEAVDIGM